MPGSYVGTRVGPQGADAGVATGRTENTRMRLDLAAHRTRTPKDDHRPGRTAPERHVRARPQLRLVPGVRGQESGVSKRSDGPGGVWPADHLVRIRRFEVERIRQIRRRRATAPSVANPQTSSARTRPGTS